MKLSIENKFLLGGSLWFVIMILAIIISSWGLTYITEHEAGYYCDYCHKGSYRNKTEVLHKYGSQPCEVAPDSIHSFSYWFCAPHLQNKPKYVK